MRFLRLIRPDLQIMEGGRDGSCVVRAAVPSIADGIAARGGGLCRTVGAGGERGGYGV